MDTNFKIIIIQVETHNLYVGLHSISNKTYKTTKYEQTSHTIYSLW